jgi:hypothetical protein
MEILSIFKHALMISFFVFVMITQFPAAAWRFLFFFVSGIFFAWISDKVIKVLKFVP